MRKLLRVLFVTALLLPAGISAQEHRPYVVMSGLLLALVDSDWSDTVDEAPLCRPCGVSGEFDFDTGYGVTLAFGYGANPGISVEFEAGYRTVDIGGIDGIRVEIPTVPEISVPGGLSVRGDVDTLSMMANSYYTFDTEVFRPYIGAGIGLAQHKAKFPEQVLRTSEGNVVIGRSSSDDVVFAYQFMAGLNWTLADNIEARAGYRYFATKDGDFDGTKADYKSHTIDAGLLIRH